MMYTVCNRHPLVEMCMLFVGTSIIHHSTEGIFILCNIWDLLIYSYNGKKAGNEFAKKCWIEDIEYVSQLVNDNTHTIRAELVRN